MERVPTDREKSLLILGPDVDTLQAKASQSKFFTGPGQSPLVH